MKSYSQKPEPLSRNQERVPKAANQAPAHVILQNYKERFLTQRKEEPNNTGLPDELKSGIENLSGYSMDDVKVHYNSNKPAQLQALAYTQGSNIYVAPGQEKHLPHEAWHVVQQKQGRVQPTMQLKGVQVNDNKGLERKADVMEANVIQRMIMVPGLSSIDKGKNKDPFLLSHIHWATQVTGGNIVEDSIDGIEQEENLHLVQHGDIGKISGTTVKNICDMLKSQLPKGYKGNIHVSSCWSGVKTKDTPTSLIEDIKANLRADLKNVNIIGYAGPTITNYHSQGGKIPTVNPKFVPIARAIQKRMEKATEFQNIFKNINDFDSGGDIIKLVEYASKQLKPFYDAFIGELNELKILLPESQAQVQTIQDKRESSVLEANHLPGAWKM